MRPAADLLNKIVVDSLRRLPASEVPLAAWEFAAGRAVAERTRALSFTGGTLTVEVPDATWRSQLRDMAPAFLSKLNHFSSVRVQRLEFTLAAQEKR